MKTAIVLLFVITGMVVNASNYNNYHYTVQIQKVTGIPFSDVNNTYYGTYSVYATNYLNNTYQFTRFDRNFTCDAIIESEYDSSATLPLMNCLGASQSFFQLDTYYSSGVSFYINYTNTADYSDYFYGSTSLYSYYNNRSLGAGKYVFYSANYTYTPADTTTRTYTTTTTTVTTTQPPVKNSYQMTVQLLDIFNVDDTNSVDLKAQIYPLGSQPGNYTLVCDPGAPAPPSSSGDGLSFPNQDCSGQVSYTSPNYNNPSTQYLFFKPVLSDANTGKVLDDCGFFISYPACAQGTGIISRSCNNDPIEYKYICLVTRSSKKLSFIEFMNLYRKGVESKNYIMDV